MHPFYKFILLFLVDSVLENKISHDSFDWCARASFSQLECKIDVTHNPKVGRKFISHAF